VTLNDGRVLVTGGTDSAYNLVASTELYDPSAITPAWILSGDLNYPRSYNAISLLVDGRVLVAGGDTATGTTRTAEIFNPTAVGTNGIAGTWTSTALMAYARNSATATLLTTGPNAGKVLVVGGYDTNAALVLPCELYDPVANTWTVTGSLHNGRFYHSATLMTSGKVLVVGGGADNTAFLATAELYDPATGAWTLTRPLSSSRFNHTATLLTVSTGLDYGKVLVVGGLDNAGIQLMSTELYDPVADLWTTTSSLVDARDNFTSTLIPVPITDTLHPNGKVLSVGGYGVTSILNSSELYW
jgi:hypothetical protein